MTVSAEGTTLVSFRSVDALGTASAWSAAQAGGTAKIDLVAPTMPSVLGGSSTWTTAASVTISASGSTDTAGSGVVGYEYETARPQDATPWSAPIPGNSVVITDEGTTQVRFFAVDRAGNISDPGPATTTSASMAQIDRTPPLTPILTFAAGCTAHPKQVTAYADDGHYGSATASYNYVLNGGPVQKANVLGAVNLTQAGTYTIKYQGVDQAGLVGPWSAVTTVCAS